MKIQVALCSVSRAAARSLVRPRPPQCRRRRRPTRPVKAVRTHSAEEATEPVKEDGKWGEKEPQEEASLPTPASMCSPLINSSLSSRLLLSVCVFASRRTDLPPSSWRSGGAAAAGTRTHATSSTHTSRVARVGPNSHTTQLARGTMSKVIAKGAVASVDAAAAVTPEQREAEKEVSTCTHWCTHTPGKNQPATFARITDSSLSLSDPLLLVPCHLSVVSSVISAPPSCSAALSKAPPQMEDRLPPLHCRSCARRFC